MDYVIDANVLISMLITGRASYYTLAKHFHFYLPSFALQELEEYQDVVFEQSRLQPGEVRRFARQLFPLLTITPTIAVDPDSRKQAEVLAKAIDPKDREYVALALQLSIPLLSRDKPLTAGLRKKGFRQVMLFSEFLEGV